MKPERYDLIPVGALALVAKLYGRGAEKYAEHNWRRGYDWSKSYAALNRHLNAFWAGEDIDEEMQLPHLASVVFHTFALMTFMEEHPQFDDRFIGPKTKSDMALAELRAKLIVDVTPPSIIAERLDPDPGTDYAMRQARARNLQ
jgi:hypothetical protein